MSNERLYGGKTYSEILEEGLQYVLDRKYGKIKSLRTPWRGLNDVGLNGIEWGSLVTIGARPSSGKTLMLSQILKESYLHNPDQEFNILEFQFEMNSKQTSVRDFAAECAADYNIILSSSREIDDFLIENIKHYIETCKELENKGIKRLQINKPITPDEIYEAVHFYYKELGNKPMIITIDHSWLIKKAKEEREKINTLYNTMERLIQLKNELPVIIIMLTQLNREIDQAIRKEPYSIANYPTSADIFGGDALMQGSDMVFALSRPAKLDMQFYGPKGYVVSKNDIYLHLLKVRNNSDDQKIIFMQGQFEHGRLRESVEPLQQPREKFSYKSYTKANITSDKEADKKQ